MKRFSIQFMLLLFLGELLFLFAEAQTSGSPVTVLSDVEYASVDDHRLLLDLYLPGKVEGAPLLIWVHGGAWRAGSKSRMPLTALVEEGWAIASVDYRLTPVARFPAQVHDIKAAVRFLRAKAADYGFDAERIAVAGNSAGGHLAALVGVSNGHKDLEGSVGQHLEESSDVQATVSLYGASNLSTILDQSTPHGLGVRIPALQLLLGGQPQDKTEIARLASPIFHVDPSDPPLLLIHGDQDPQMPISQSHELNGRYKELGLSVRFEVVHGAAHGGPEFYDQTRLQIIREFLKTHVLLEGVNLPSGSPANEPSTLSCSEFMAPKRNVNGQMVGQEECLMRDHGIVEPDRKYHRVDMGFSGTLSGWVVRQGARQNYFTSGPDFIYTQFGNPHSPRYHGILRYEAEKGTSLTLTYPETGWNGKLFVLVHGRSGSFLRGTMRPWDEYFDPEKPFDANKYEKAMLAKGYAIARTRRNADGFAIGDYSAVLDDGTVWPDQNINMVPELILDEVRLLNNFLKERLGQRPTRNYWYGHSAGGYTGLALNYLIQSNPDINRDSDGRETISGFINDDPGGGMFLPILMKDGQDILYRTPESKAQFVKSFSIAHQAYPLVYSNIVPGEMDLNNIPEGISPVALNNKRKMAKIMIDKGIKNFRMYEVRGVSHSGGERYPDGKNGDIQILDLSRFMDGVIDLLDNWVEKGIEPPGTKSDDPGVGASAAAVDLPETACPLGRYYPFPQFRGVQGAGSTGFAPYDGTSLEPLNGQLQFVDMNENGRRDRRETVTEAWLRMGLLKRGETFDRAKYVACVQRTASKLRKENLITEQVAQLYVKDAGREALPKK